MLSAEAAPGMGQICERDKKRTLPSTPFLRAWLVAELGAKKPRPTPYWAWVRVRSIVTL